MLSTDAATGQVTVLKNGVQMETTTGQPTKDQNNHTDIYLDVPDAYGNFGSADFDEVSMSTVGADSTPPAAPMGFTVQ